MIEDWEPSNELSGYCPQVAPPNVPRSRRADPRHRNTRERDQEQPGRACLHFFGRTRRRENHGGADPRESAELREGSDAGALRRMRFVQRDRRGHIAGRYRNRRGIEPRNRPDPRAAGDGELRTGIGAEPGGNPRRSAHADWRGIERAAENAGRGARSRNFGNGDDRPGESGGHDPVKVATLSFSRAGARRDQRAVERTPAGSKPATRTESQYG